MLQFQIKTYTPQRDKAPNSFYVLSKGLNSGRPSATPCPNSFVVSAGNPEEKETLYWLTYAIWKSRALYPLLRGSVIPFITVRDFTRQLAAACQSIPPTDERIQKVVTALKKLDETEAQARGQIKIIAEARQLIARKLLS